MATGYAIDLMERLDLARSAIDHALGGVGRLAEQKLPDVDLEYLLALYQCQEELERAKRALLKPFTPYERVAILEGRSDA